MHLHVKHLFACIKFFLYSDFVLKFHWQDDTSTVEPQWSRTLDHENSFETWVVRATEG